MANIVDTASVASVKLRGYKGASNMGKDEEQEARTELARLLRLYMRETSEYLRTSSRRTKRVSNYWLPEDVIESSGQVKMECDMEATESECRLIEASPRPPLLVLR